MKWLKGVFILIVCYIVVSMIAFPQSSVAAVNKALNLCITSVVPALFPFFVCSSLLVSLGMAEFGSRFLSGIMKPVFGINGSGAVALVLGIISGYPVGADCAVNLYNSGKITKREAERLIGFCNNSGPLFIIGTVGFCISGSAALGGILYIIHITSAVATGVVLSRLIKEDNTVNPTVISEKQKRSVKIVSAFGDAVSKSVVTILNVCGFVVFFAVAESTIPEFFAHPFVNGLLEITGGINDISKMNMDFALKISLISMFLAFSGLSVFLQVASIAADSDLEMRYYALGKFIQGIIAFVLTYVLFFILKTVGAWSPAYLPYSGEDMALWYAYPVTNMNIKSYLILIAGETVWCLLSIGILAAIAKKLPDD